MAGRRRSGGTAMAGMAQVGSGSPQGDDQTPAATVGAGAAALGRALALARLGSERVIGRTAAPAAGDASIGRRRSRAVGRWPSTTQKGDGGGGGTPSVRTETASPSGGQGGRGGAPEAQGRRGQHGPAAVGTGKSLGVGGGWWRQWRLRFQGCCPHPVRGYSNSSSREQRLLRRRCSRDGTAGDRQRWSGHLPGTFQQQDRVHQGLGHQCQGGEGGEEKRGGEEALAGASPPARGGRRRLRRTGEEEEREKVTAEG